jgi:hypothetical protein
LSRYRTFLPLQTRVLPPVQSLDWTIRRIDHAILIAVETHRLRGTAIAERIYVQRPPRCRAGKDSMTGKMVIERM